MHCLYYCNSFSFLITKCWQDVLRWHIITTLTRYIRICVYGNWWFLFVTCIMNLLPVRNKIFIWNAGWSKCWRLEEEKTGCLQWIIVIISLSFAKLLIKAFTKQTVLAGVPQKSSCCTHVHLLACSAFSIPNTKVPKFHLQRNCLLGKVSRNALPLLLPALFTLKWRTSERGWLVSELVN